LPSFYTCPLCRSPLEQEGGALVCPRDGWESRPEDGIHDFLTPERSALHDTFIEEYTAIRHTEGRGWETAANYLIYPYIRLPEPMHAEVKLRVKSLEWLWGYLNDHVQKQGDREWNPLTVLDAGAGFCWLTRYLAHWGHHAVAVDLSIDDRDGLRAARHYLDNLPLTFDRVRAAFEALPFADETFDVIIFNGALHYALDLQAVLAEAKRVMKSGGVVIIMDSPFYHDLASGEKMLGEREGNARSRYLVYDTLREIAAALGLTMEIHKTEPAAAVKLKRRLREMAMGREIAEMPRVVLRDVGQ
jgi:SAM-dependent methyltransferase